jgi:hypothetical protein
MSTFFPNIFFVLRTAPNGVRGLGVAVAAFYPDNTPAPPAA